MKRNKLICLALALSMLLAGCDENKEEDRDDNAGAAVLDSGKIFSDRDREQGYSSGEAVNIQLQGDTATAPEGVTVSGSTLTVTKDGVYILSGQLQGTVVVDTGKNEKVQLVLANAVIHSETSAAIYVKQADKVFLTTAKGSRNTLSSGEVFNDPEDSGIDAAVFSKDDLTLNGEGSLTVTSPGGHGIVSKDELILTGGSYTVTAAAHGICGKDNVCIAGGNITVDAGKDGIHSENQEDETLGFVYVERGNFVINAEGDGISASSDMQILGGSYEITAGGGSGNSAPKPSENWGGRPGSKDTSAVDNSASGKGLKAGGSLSITGGSFRMDAADDALHANADVQLSGGSFTLSTGDDGIHADNDLTVSGSQIQILESYEGLEALNITVTSGNISLTASDDGLNAAGGNDGSGFGGHRGGDMFGKGGNGYIRITGGTVSVIASGDGIDANGTLEITGGTVTVQGPTRGDTAVLDFDRQGIISGGSFIGTGSRMMAQSFTQSSQGVLALDVGSQRAGTEILVTDDQGRELLRHTPQLDYNIVILTTPQMVRGESYTIRVGSETATFEAK